MLVGASVPSPCGHSPQWQRQHSSGKGRGLLLATVYVVALVMVLPWGHWQAQVCAFSVLHEQELRAGDDLLFSVPSFTPKAVLAQGQGTGGGSGARWLCAHQGFFPLPGEGADCTLGAAVTGWGVCTRVWVGQGKQNLPPQTCSSQETWGVAVGPG